MKFKIEEVPSFYQGYINKASNHELMGGLEYSEKKLLATCSGLSESQALFRYAEGKWSTKDLVQHLIDAERVFAYRALRFARNDQTELSGFEQDDYVNAVFADKFSLSDLLQSFSHVRRSTLDLFSSFSESELVRSGKSNGVAMTVEMLGYIISGHTLHHVDVIQEKYLS